MNCAGKSFVKLFLATLIVLLFSACNPDARKYPVTATFSSDINTKFLLEVAATPRERAKGLMYRNNLEQNKGMLFVFPNAEPQSFWMKNTQISLDIIYIDEQLNVVSIRENAKPLSEEPLDSGGKFAKYVIEINGGLSKKHRIDIGSKITLDGELPIAN
jgi:uncharacterized membrane protein (UPF0127 family)